MPSDDELREDTLAFSGSYVSDDGTVTVSRSVGRAFGYSGDRFVGWCTTCIRELLLSATGEPLPDLAAALRFVALHDHGGVD